MSLASIVRSAVAAANTATIDLQDTVGIEAWISHDESADPTYAPSVSVAAVVSRGPVPFRTADGTVITAKAVIQILKPIAANGATGRSEPIDPRDRITLPNGDIGAPIMGASGVVDPATGYPYAYRVALG